MTIQTTQRKPSTNTVRASTCGDAFKMSVSTLNLRSPGTLADILHDVRSCRISDRSWHLLQDRVLGVAREGDKMIQEYAPHADPRLTAPPFSNNFVQYIVHRHVLRVAQSFHNLMTESTRRCKRLYVVLASDTVRSAEIAMYTENVRTEVLRIANPRKTKQLPGSCLLFYGMRLLLFSKKCARLGLMNGCACVLEDILMHDREVLPSRSEVGEVIPLQFMPTALLLRAEDAKWTLPPEQLPPLPESVSRRGLFFVTTAHSLLHT